MTSSFGMLENERFEKKKHGRWSSSLPSEYSTLTPLAALAVFLGSVTSPPYKLKLGLSAILCMETNPNQPPLACLLGFSGITSLVIMVWLKATAAGLGLGQLQLFAICCGLWFWFSSFVFLLIYGGFPFAERRQNTPSWACQAYVSFGGWW